MNSDGRKTSNDKKGITHEGPHRLFQYVAGSAIGPAYVAGALRQAGHIVRVFERLFADDVNAELTDVLQEFQPDVIGLSIRLVFGDELDPNAPLGTRHTDLRPRVREIAEIIRPSKLFSIPGSSRSILPPLP